MSSAALAAILQQMQPQAAPPPGMPLSMDDVNAVAFAPAPQGPSMAEINASALAPNSGANGGQVAPAGTEDLENRRAAYLESLRQRAARQAQQSGGGGPSDDMTLPAQTAAAAGAQGVVTPNGQAVHGGMGVLKQFLTRFMYGGGQAMAKWAGLPTDAELALQASERAHMNAQTGLINEQVQQMHTLVPVPDPFGRPMVGPDGQPVMVSAATLKSLAPLLGRAYGAQVSGQYGLANRALANQGALDAANAKRTPQLQLGQQYLDALNNGDDEGAQHILAQLSQLSAAAAKPAKQGDFGQFYSKYLSDNGLEDSAANMLAARKQWETHPLQPGAQEARNASRADRSYQYHSGVLDKLATPIDSTVSRLGRLQDTLAQNSPQADALVAPELLTVMAGGQGSGLRMNEAEISRIVGGRSNWESLKAAANKWSTDPASANSITPAQRQQIRALVAEVGNKLQAKQATLDAARQQLISSDDPLEHRRIYADARAKLSAIDSGATALAAQGASAGATLPAQAAAQLQEGRYTTFANGQTWTRTNGSPMRVK